MAAMNAGMNRKQMVAGGGREVALGVNDGPRGGEWNTRTLRKYFTNATQVNQTGRVSELPSTNQFESAVRYQHVPCVPKK